MSEINQKEIGLLTLQTLKPACADKALDEINNKIIEASEEGKWEIRTSYDETVPTLRSYLINYYRSLGFEVEPYSSDFFEREILTISWRFR